jgi:adenosine deaminase
MSLTSHILAMPKAELHIHLEGSVGPETLLTLAENNKLRLPFASVEAVKQLYTYRDFAQFAQTLLLGVKCMRREEDFVLVVERLGAELARQNIRYAEVIWTPQFYLGRPYPLSAVLAALNAGRARVRQQWGVEMRWVPDLVRSVPAPMQVIGRWVSSDEAIAGGTVALGLGGPETGYPAERFEEPFRWARDAGLFANPHAGENAGPSSVRAALEVLKATRIGHGVRVRTKREACGFVQKHLVPRTAHELDIAGLRLRGDGRGSVDLISAFRRGLHDVSSQLPHEVPGLRLAGLTGVLRNGDSTEIAVRAGSVLDGSFNVQGRATQANDIFNVENSVTCAAQFHPSGPGRIASGRLDGRREIPTSRRGECARRSLHDLEPVAFEQTAASGCGALLELSGDGV